MMRTTHRIAFALILVLTALCAWACESTDEKPDAKATAVDIDAAKAACAAGGMAECGVYADAAMRSRLTRAELIAARDQLAVYCTVDQPDVCRAVRALAFRIDQPRFEGDWSPVSEPDDAAEVFIESPRRARYVDAAPQWLAEGRIKSLGTVTVEVDVRRDGEIHAMRVVQSADPVLDRMTMEAALDNRYLPARKGVVHRDATLSYSIDWGTTPKAGDAGPAAPTSDASVSVVSKADAGPAASDAGTAPRVSDAGAVAPGDAG